MGRFDQTWNIDNIYTGPDDGRFTEDVKDTSSKLAGLLSDEGGDVDLSGMLDELDRASMTLSTPETYLAMFKSTNGGSDPSGSADKMLNDALIKKQKAISKAERELASFAYSGSVDKDLLTGGLEPYGFMIEESRRLEPHRPSPEVQDILLNMAQNGSSAWADLRNTLDASASVKIRLNDSDETISLTKARALQSSGDPETRRIAYEAELASYPSWEVPMAASLNGIKGEAIAELGYKGYASVSEEMLDINKMRKNTLNALHQAIEKHLPALRDYLLVKGRYFGYTSGLPWYDLTRPVAKGKGEISFDKAHDMVTEALGAFSSELGELAHRAFVSRWIDALPRKGKSSGGICYDIPKLRENRILVNYNGSFHDMLTIAHELGHAYHSRCLDGLPLLLRDVPTPICETASLFNETIVSEALQTMKGDRLELLDADLMEAVSTVMEIYSRYIFEDMFFDKRKNGRLTPHEICDLMSCAQRTVFGDSLDGTKLHPYMWMCKVHYYIPGFHYYSYPYYFGMLLSKGLYSDYLKDREGFPSRYRDFLKASSSSLIENSVSLVGADISSEEFWNGALDQIDKKCEEFCSSL